jgi:hypothetical protein
MYRNSRPDWSPPAPRPEQPVETFLARALKATGDGSATGGAVVPWICDALLSNHSVKAYGRDFMDLEGLT